MKLTRGSIMLLLPALVVFFLLLVLPLTNVLNESFKLYVPGQIGSATDAPYTLNNYAELLVPAYVMYFLDTLRIGFIASIIALLVSYPIGYFVARQRSGRIRKLSVGFLIAMMFLSILVRVYSLELTFGPVGFMGVISRMLGLAPNNPIFTEMMVIMGLLHYIIPVCALTLTSTIQNVNPSLAAAAETLGAARWKAHLTVTVPLSLRGIMSAFLISYTLCISAFVIPMILGKGRILFVSNLIYSRFSEVANYPSGSAISAVMMILVFIIIYITVRSGSNV
jgi:ABC-type spermidine/putrescine transport system permease subunit I